MKLGHNVKTGYWACFHPKTCPLLHEVRNPTVSEFGTFYCSSSGKTL